MLGFRYCSVNPKILPFYLEEKTRELCKECKRYGLKASCPPYLPTLLEYKQLFLKYNKGVLIVKNFIIDDPKNWQRLGHDSSEEIRIELNKLAQNLISKDYVMFGAGSCKNCNTCSLPNCRFPEKRLIPLEGTGLNVVNLVADVADIEIEFPVEAQGYFVRVGMILWN